MNILCFSDLHRDTEAAKNLVKQSKQADLLIGAGDFATIHVGLTKVIDILCEIQIPAVLVPGNAETVEELREACADWKNAAVLHGEGALADDTPIYGVGGAIPPLNAEWSYDITEEEASQLLEDCPQGAILVVHSPPFGHVDMTTAGDNIGSKAILETIESKNPILAVCGHVHACWRQQSIHNNTTIINAGPQGIIIELE